MEKKTLSREWDFTTSSGKEQKYQLGESLSKTLNIGQKGSLRTIHNKWELPNIFF